MVAYTVEHVPRWNPVNICSYHLQEAGATPVQEIAFALANATAVLDAVRERQVSAQERTRRRVCGMTDLVLRQRRRALRRRAVRSSARSRSLWEELGRERYGVERPGPAALALRRAGQLARPDRGQPENNVQRIVLETLAVTLGRNARARAVQLPAWNEALGLPRPWDQQWSLRIQQVLAYETDLLEYPDIFEGSTGHGGLVASSSRARAASSPVSPSSGGAVEAVPYMKAALVESNRARLRRIESGEQVVVGVNRYTETEPSPLTADGASAFLTVDPAHERAQIEALERWRGRARRQRGGGGAGGAGARGAQRRLEPHGGDDRGGARGW
jgi:(2R)-ethylmalonyl-CoA mutase